LIAAIATLFIVASFTAAGDRPSGIGLIESYFRGFQAGMERSMPEAQAATRKAKKARHASAENGHGDRRVLDLVAYKGLASWVDIFDKGPWEDPIRAVKRMHRRGVKTLFLQTSTYGIFKPVFKREKVFQFLHASHKRDMKVVAWYVPSFAHPIIDLRRVRSAVRFESPAGERFDSFAMDIESNVVGNIKTRNQQLITLSSTLRKEVGDSYPLGAITPDPCCSSGYWPNFPYKEVRKHFDVFVPMGYWTFRASGYKGTKHYTSRNIAIIRRETGDPHVPIHMIGGIADSASKKDLKGFVSALKQSGVIGASLYDFPITTKTAWKALKSVPDPDKQD
jgi:hypothetical protein